MTTHPDTFQMYCELHKQNPQTVALAMLINSMDTNSPRQADYIRQFSQLPSEYQEAARVELAAMEEE